MNFELTVALGRLSFYYDLRRVNSKSRVSERRSILLPTLAPLLSTRLSAIPFKRSEIDNIKVDHAQSNLRQRRAGKSMFPARTLRPRSINATGIITWIADYWRASRAFDLVLTLINSIRSVVINDAHGSGISLRVAGSPYLQL